MIVTQEHDIDGRKVSEAQAGISMSLWTSPGKRTCTVGPDWIGQDVQPGRLNQYCGVVDKRDP
jgi:hypothetical protein